MWKSSYPRGRATGSLADGDAHRASGAVDDLFGGFDAVGVQVLHLLLSDVAQLLRGDAANLRLVRRARALLHARGLVEQVRGGWGLDDEGERAVFVDGDHGRHDAAHHAGRTLVVRLAEAHDIDAVRAERRTNRLRRRRLAGWDLQLYDSFDALCHVNSSRGRGAERSRRGTTCRHREPDGSHPPSACVGPRRAAPQRRLRLRPNTLLSHTNHTVDTDAAPTRKPAQPGRAALARTTRGLLLLDLQEIELDRRFAAKERHQHRDFVALGRHFADGADELGEGAIHHLDGLADLECDLGLRLRLLALGRRLQDVAQLAFLQRHRFGARPADEAGDAGRVAHDVPDVVVQHQINH